MNKLIGVSQKIASKPFVEVLKTNLKYGSKVVKDEGIKKAVKINNWYTRVLGLDEVRQYQERVVSLQEKLLETQDLRRTIGRELAEVRKQSNELQDHLHKVNRQDDFEKFLVLMRSETEMLQKEKEIMFRFNECDRAEREIFTAFTNAVRDSHEKQRAQLEYTKYFGLILSLVGSFMTFCYSTMRKRDLKQFVETHVVSASGETQEILDRLKINIRELNQAIAKTNAENAQVINLLSANRNQLLNNDNSTVLNETKITTERLIALGYIAFVGLLLIKLVS